ncbi:hypothetical protein ZIOFF_023487 [Zingiber officinale]|uniref:LOB domain-containing protein n=1 Tax=Zingiber officinale TaxID=94328 RepID=A0A8J5GUQ7_ZINOF|nr:hypothetical protein ZIOFF_023487 [Zingiber officinale]
MVSATAAASSPCAACKLLRRKCLPECAFAPYFPPDQPQKFAQVHRVFGASNVTKLLQEVPPGQREDAVNSLAYEADMRLRDPVYGCAGFVALLHRQLRQLRLELALVRAELAMYQKQTVNSNDHGSCALIDVNLPCVDQLLPPPAKAATVAGGDHRPAIAPLCRNVEAKRLVAEDNSYSREIRICMHISSYCLLAFNSTHISLKGSIKPYARVNWLPVVLYCPT